VRRLARPLLYGGTAAAVLGFGAWHASHVGHYRFVSSSRFSWSLAYIVLLALAAYGVGLPDLVRDRRRSFGAAVAAACAAAAGISLAQLVLGSQLLPRFVVFSSALVLVPWCAMCARLADDGRQRDSERDRVLAVVGPGEAAMLDYELEMAAERPATLVAVLPREAAQPTPHQRPLIERAVTERATVVVLDRDAAADDQIVEQVAELHERGVRVRTLTLFYDEWLGKLPLSELERVSLMFDIGELHRARYGRLKRVLDVGAGLVGLAVLAIAAPVVVIGNCIANRGPLFYRQVRVGRGGRPFTMVKLRTMVTDPGPSEWTAEDDPRITPFGRWLRRTHVDELPQAWNVLRGDLSLVGPRPEQPGYADELKEKIAFYDFRHLVRPGLTGWAQVKYDYGASETDALEKLQYEFWYLRHQGLALDARVVGRTVRSVIGRSGR
jgi:lipopolysaccharide/colanic/teichoic acid biosynthesis glycosyltransferase